MFKNIKLEQDKDSNWCASCENNDNVIIFKGYGANRKEAVQKAMVGYENLIKEQDIALETAWENLVKVQSYIKDNKKLDKIIDLISELHSEGFAKYM